MLLSIMATLSTSTMMMKHPLSMGITLILQTLMISMLCGTALKSFLFSYIIMIIMMSGALVLFIYMASVASNEKFQTSIKMLIVSIIIMTITYQHKAYNYMEWNTPKDIKTLIKMFNTMSSFTTMMMIMYLMFTMIVVSGIASNKEGPLRMKQ
uniref:NADH dehydrogenase subunit 6 n=1 Tax=Calacta lugubris TaxID=2880907 RepID=UPI001D10785F|nr:NADH dehydrogenase subunit 6 [Calacta lugubris]UCC45932.1 NADH dehydrogenase subunit 6 [Calacta lugubris]